MSKNLTFKLIMDADSKGFVSGVKQSESVAKSVFDAIKAESDKLKQSSAEAAKELGNIIPKGTSELAAGLTKSLSSATEIIKNAGENAKSTAGNFTDFGNKSHKALDLLKSDLTSAKQKLQEFANSNASPADIEVAQRQVDQLEKEVQQADQAFNDFQAEVGKANVKLKESDSAAAAAKKGLDGAKFAVNALVGAMAALGVGLGLRELAEAADSYTNLSTRIQIATKDGGNFESAMAGVHQVALATNSSLQATGDLFTRIDAVGKEMGMTQQQALDLTKTVTQAIQIGGGSAQASEAAITQFIQAMQGGVLRGEEFNSIMENGYGLAEALAKGLGVTTGELRKMAENGELTSERVAKALQSQAAEVQATYDQFPTTISNALQKIATSWQILIGEMDQAHGASSVVAEALSTIADNLGILKVFFDDVAEGVGWFRDKLAEIDPATIDAMRSALSDAYDVVKNLIKSMAGIAETAWSAFTSTLDAISPLFNAMLSGQQNVSGLTTLFNVFRVALGVVSDAATGLNIGLKLLLSGLQFLAGGLTALQAKVLDFIGFDTLAKQAQDASDRLFAQAEKNAKEANRLALESKSATIAALEDIRKTDEEKNQERIANSKQTLERLKEQEDKHLADHKANVEQRLTLEKKLAEARKSNNVEVINAVLKEISVMDEAEEKAAQDRIKRDKEKLDSARALAEASIESNNGVLSDLVKEDLLRSGIIAKVNEQGRLEVSHHEDSSQLNAERMAKLEALSEQESKLNQDRVIDSQKVSKSVVRDEEYIASERIRLNDAANKAKQSGDFEAYSQAKLAIDNLKNAHAQANQERTNQHRESSNAIQQIDSSTFALQKNYSEEQIRLSKVAAQAKKDGDFEVYSQAMLQIDNLSASEIQASQKVSQSDLETLKKKEDVARQKVALAQQIIESTNGIITEEQKLKFEAQGLTVEYDEMGKAVIRQKASLSSAAKALGIDLSQSLNLVSIEFTETEKNLDAFSAGLKDLGVEGKQAGEVTYEAWQKWAEKAKSQAEIDAAKAKLIEFEKQGVFSAKQVQMGMEYLDQVNGKLPQNISEVEKAYRLLGIASREEASKIADAQMKAFNVLKQSGTATAEQLKQALINMSDKIYASGDAAKISWYEGQLAANNLEASIDSTGKASVKAMDELTEANHRVRESARRIGDGYREAGQIAREEANAAQIAWNKASQEAAQKWDAEMKRQSKGLSAAISGYQSMSKNDVISQIKSMGYSEDQAKKLAGSIWSQAMATDRDAKFAAYGKGGNLAMNKLIEQEFNNAAAKGLTTQHGTNKINELLRNLDVRSIGNAPKVNDYVPNISEPKIRDLQNDAPTKNVRFEFVSGGKRLEMYGSQEDGDTMESLLREFEMLKKAM